MFSSIFTLLVSPEDVVSAINDAARVRGLTPEAALEGDLDTARSVVTDACLSLGALWDLEGSTLRVWPDRYRSWPGPVLN